MAVLPNPNVMYPTPSRDSGLYEEIPYDMLDNVINKSESVSFDTKCL